MTGSDCASPAALTFPPNWRRVTSIHFGPRIGCTSWLLLPADPPRRARELRAAIFQFVIIVVAKYDALLPTTTFVALLQARN